MGKDELDGLDKILLTMFQEIDVNWRKTLAILPNDALRKAKSAILAWCVKQLPEKKEQGFNFPNEYFTAGFNDAIDEMKRRFE